MHLKMSSAAISSRGDELNKRKHVLVFYVPQNEDGEI